MPFYIKLEIEKKRTTINPVHLRGWVLNTLQKISPEVSARLHDEKKPTLYRCYHEENTNAIDLYFYFLDDSILLLLMNYLLKNQINEVILGENSYKIYNMKHEACYWNNFNNKEEKFVKILFKSPFQFRHSILEDGESFRKIQLIPSPQSIIEHLANKWNRLYNEQVHQICLYSPEDISSIQKRISEQRIAGNTSFLKTERGIERGFVGEVVLEFHGGKEIYQKFKMLIDFAAWSGVGSRLSLGLGHINVSWYSDLQGALHGRSGN